MFDMLSSVLGYSNRFTDLGYVSILQGQNMCVGIFLLVREILANIRSSDIYVVAATLPTGF